MQTTSSEADKETPSSHAPSSKKELLILRHGKSDWSQKCDDFNRPLKKRGKLGAFRIGAYLSEQKLQPDRILSSPALRAKHTAEKAIKAMGSSVEHIVLEDELYEANVEQLLSVLKQQPNQVNRILIVGHNPGLELLIEYLAGPITPAEDGKKLPTATLAQLEFNQSWAELAPLCAQLKTIVRAKDLGYNFPALENGKMILRERPAYYYQQSAALCYRFDNGELEFLLIRSSSNKHWSIPKGIVEPGLSPALSAEKEVLEEAGAQGTVTGESLGHYQINKWGGLCKVEVFAFAVSDLLDEEQWPEHHRGRRWLKTQDLKAQLEDNPNRRKIYPFFQALSERLKSAGQP